MDKCQIGDCPNDPVRRIEIHIPAYDGEEEQHIKVDLCSSHLLWLKGRQWAKTPEDGV